MIKLTFNGSDARVVAAIRQKVPQLQRALSIKLNTLSYLLQAKIVGEKLSGQVLAHRTGKLAGSVQVEESTPGSLIVASVRAGGGPAFYGRFHEYGTTNFYTIQPINKKALAFMMGGKQVIVKFVNHPPIKERSFMRSSLAEMKDSIVAGLQEEVNRVLSE